MLKDGRKKRDGRVDFNSHDWEEGQYPEKHPDFSGKKMAKCRRCGFEILTEDITIFPLACDEELVRGIMKR
ncbi:MAG TPA: hypothetical protein VIE65_13930 [Methylobacter sp.]